MKARKAFILALPFLLVGCKSYEACPSEDKVVEMFKDQWVEGLRVESIEKVEDVPGLCEVVVRDGINVNIFYVNPKANKVFLGSIVDPKAKKNITLERKKELTKLTADQLKGLDELVDFEHGEGNRFVYYITDPDCKICRKQEDQLLKWAKENKVKLKVILYPLPIHKNAFKRSVSILCDKKGFEGVMKEYESENQCEEGKNKILKNIKFLGSELKMIGLPHVIGSNGRIVSGVLKKEELDKLID